MRRVMLCFTLGALWLPALADIRFRNLEDPDAPAWQEQEAQLPSFPKEENLLEFYVSAATSNRFFVDGETLSPGIDGAVRYVLVVRTAGGATNITYEGLRCQTLEHRLYATGRVEGTWIPSRTGAWKPVSNPAMNRHHAALSRDYLCPSRLPIATAEEGRDALRRGGHPNAK